MGETPMPRKESDCLSRIWRASGSRVTSSDGASPAYNCNPWDVAAHCAVDGCGRAAGRVAGGGAGAADAGGAGAGDGAGDAGQTFERLDDPEAERAGAVEEAAAGVLVECGVLFGVWGDADGGEAAGGAGGVADTRSGVFDRRADVQSARGIAGVGDAAGELHVLSVHAVC